MRRGDVASADAWPTAPHNLRCGGNNIIVGPGLPGFRRLVLWNAQEIMELSLGASLCGLLRLLRQPMRQRAVAKPKQKMWMPVDLLPFEGYWRDCDTFQLPYLEHLQAQELPAF
ncbi:hypothetical protein F5883DRAFT_653368 [Diaporthe sp. PMI_573]|nr:hypothetical protein F5883DRAFT_653368 [Diaporthaceae sp. PMI_573]